MKKSFFKFFCIFAISSWILSNPVLARNYIEIFKDGKIDWSNGIIEAVGMGSPPFNSINSAQARALAKKAAVTKTRRNLLEIISHVKIDSGTLMNDFLGQNDEINKEIQSLVKNSRIVDVSYKSDGLVKATATLKLNGSFTDLVLPKNILTIEPIKLPQTPMQKGKAVFTGLVVDCRGFRVRPAMAPRIVDEDGKEVFGSAFVSRDYAIKQGMVKYVKGLKEAQKNSRVAGSPLTVKGIRTAKTGLSDIVISTADAARIRESANNLRLLQKCRIMIVLD